MTRFNTEIYTCAYSIDRHYVTQPIPLSCGHSLCKKCIPFDIDNDDYRIKCKLCGQMNSIEFDDVNETLLSKEAFKGNINELFKDVEQRISISLQVLKDSVNDTENRINSKIDKLKEEIDDHTKLLKKRIDRINNKLQNEMDKYKDKLLESTSKIDIAEYENDMDVLQNGKISIRKLHRYEEKLRKLDNEIKELEKTNVKLNFEPSEERIDQSIFGKINYEIDFKNDIATIISERLKDDHLQIIDKNIEISDLCVLSNGKLLVASFKQHNMTLFNKNFEVVKTINKINDKLFSPLSLTTDNEERVYMCDSFNQQILMTDLDLDLIGQFGRYGNGKDKLKYPNSVYYSHNELYVSDRANNRIVKLTPYLKHIASFEVDYQPSTIKVVNYIACVKSAANKNSIYFYDLSFPPYFNFIKQHDEHYGTISVINSNFYEFNFKKKTIYCFDKNGSLDKTIKIKSFGDHDLNPECEGTIFQVNKNILINSPTDKLLIKII